MNDAPSFIKGANVTVAEDFGAFTQAGWATSISKGPANELTQTVSFVIDSNTNPGLFSAGPTVSPTGALTFTTTAHAFGLATIGVRITDNGGVFSGGVDTSAVQTFTITVTAVNDAPTCADVSLTTAEDTTGSTAPDCADVDGDALTYSIVDQPTDGSAAVVLGQLEYSPDLNFNGTDSFTYLANDGLLDSNVATVDVTVTAVNDAPTCADVSLTTAEDTPARPRPTAPTSTATR